MASLRHAFRRCRGGVSWRSAWTSSFRDGAVGAVLEPPRVFPHARDTSRGFRATAPWRAGTDETRASEAWLPWVGSVTAKDVDRVLRRVNRRIETGIVAMPATARCLETTWDHPSGHDDDEARVAANATLVFLHGFSDEAEHWREFAELLVSGTPGGCDIVLPGAPVRPFVVGGVHRHVGAWFEPRLNHRSDVEWSAVAEPSSSANGNGSGLAGSKVWRCGGIEPAVRWVDGLLADLERRGARPGSVILAGFSQGAALALAAAANKAAWRPALGGVLCLRGYLPRRADVTEEAFASSEPRKGFSKTRNERRESERRRRCFCARAEGTKSRRRRGRASPRMRCVWRARGWARRAPCRRRTRAWSSPCVKTEATSWARTTCGARGGGYARGSNARERLARSVRRVVNVGSDDFSPLEYLVGCFALHLATRRRRASTRRPRRAAWAAADTSCV